ncbi:MAG: hypothetical protein OEX11_09380 [Nitrosomonas sp.]|nr:hypothetical protein [Nitrosomonas sp.]
MTQLGEMVAVVVGKEELTCPFPHNDRESKLQNKMKNSSSSLKRKLNTESQNGAELHLPHMRKTTTDMDSSDPNDKIMKYNPHHIFPGNASWPETDLLNWIDKSAEKTKVKGDIGYDVNGYRNGIDLPSSNHLRGNWTGRGEQFQNDYAIASIEADGGKRQFHDSHSAYSDFAKEALDKIAAKIKMILMPDRGCGDDKCSAKSNEKYPPPIKILPRIESASGRLARKLHGDPTKWQIPVMTSKFSLIYKLKITQKEAVDKLSPDNFKY